jgi:outer membrane phospholipase A
LKGYMCCFAWDYTEMPGYRLKWIKVGFRPYKQGAWDFKPEIVGRVKEEVDRLLQAGFMDLRLGFQHSPNGEEEHGKDMDLHGLQEPKPSHSKR